MWLKYVLTKPNITTLFLDSIDSQFLKKNSFSEKESINNEQISKLTVKRTSKSLFNLQVYLSICMYVVRMSHFTVS